jgi:hypothetical protein
MSLGFLEVSMILQPFKTPELHAVLIKFSSKMSGFGLIVHMAVSHGVWFHLRGQLKEL